MQIVFTKNGKFSFNPINGPIQICEKSKYANLKEDYAKMLIDAGWAREYFEEKEPWLLPDWDAEAEDAKERLNEYAKKKYGKSIDKRRLVRTIINSIKRMRRETNIG